MRQHIIALVTDLMFSVRVRDVLHHLGYNATVVETSDQAQTLLNAQTALLIVDLRGDIDTTTDLVRHAKTWSIPVLAFGSHVDVARQQAARAAGCDRVVANSKFSTDLPLLVSQMLTNQQELPID